MKKIALLLIVFISFQLHAQILEQIDVTNHANGFTTISFQQLTAEGEVLSGKKNGIWISRMPSEMLFEVTNYQFGQKSGISLIFDRSGYLKQEAYYEKDLLHGTLKSWKPGGRMLLEEHYLAGKLDGKRQVFYERGQLQEESFYKNGERHGKSSWYDETGKLMTTYNYEYGQFEGVQQTYYTDGTVKSQRSYQKNKLNGPARDFYPNGKLKAEAVYANDSLVSTWKKYPSEVP